MKTKILIQVMSGCVTNVSTNAADAEIIIIDHDVCRDTETGHIDVPFEKLAPDSVTDKLSELFAGNDGYDSQIREKLEQLNF